MGWNQPCHCDAPFLPCFWVVPAELFEMVSALWIASVSKRHINIRNHQVFNSLILQGSVSNWIKFSRLPLVIWSGDAKSPPHSSDEFGDYFPAKTRAEICHCHSWSNGFDPSMVSQDNVLCRSLCLLPIFAKLPRQGRNPSGNSGKGPWDQSRSGNCESLWDPMGICFSFGFYCHLSKSFSRNHHKSWLWQAWLPVVIAINGLLPCSCQVLLYYIFVIAMNDLKNRLWSTPFK